MQFTPGLFGIVLLAMLVQAVPAPPKVLICLDLGLIVWVWVYYERVCDFVWICVSFNLLRKCQRLFIGISVAAGSMPFSASLRRPER
ncbi:hypothetical protein C8J57DRAFT_1376418, partial [Mycena rebaudengoi]